MSSTAHHTHRALIYDSPGNVSTKIVELETPEPGMGEILVKITHTGVCYSDMSIMLNSWEGMHAKVGQVGGHEGVGTIAKLGPSCDHANVKLGDRVGIKWTASACGNCDPCMAGADGICVKQKVSGYHCPGTFQEYVLSPCHYVTPIPDGVPSDIAAPLLCGGLTSYSALKKSRAQPGDWVVIAGAGGGLGHLALQIGSRSMGFRIIGLDVGGKEEFVKSCGAEFFIDVLKKGEGEAEDRVTTEIMRITGGGAAAVVVCSGSNAAYAQALSYLKFNGTLVCVGVPAEPVAIANAIPGAMVGKQLNIVGSTVGNRKEAMEILDLAKRGLVKTAIRKEKMENMSSVFRDMKAGTLQGRVVIEIAPES
ncbi:hypothetical protein V499_02661 [Pseudogymnoascus sp. VKM F-103]|nr:hypothetical protein V499_02661 [Pseudogymnoascus sp. VKM F-103]